MWAALASIQFYGYRSTQCKQNACNSNEMSLTHGPKVGISYWNNFYSILCSLLSDKGVSILINLRIVI